MLSLLLIVLANEKSASVEPEIKDDMACDVQSPDLVGIRALGGGDTCPTPGWSRNHPAPTVTSPTIKAGASVGCAAYPDGAKASRMVAKTMPTR